MFGPRSLSIWLLPPLVFTSSISVAGGAPHILADSRIEANPLNSPILDPAHANFSRTTPSLNQLIEQGLSHYQTGDYLTAEKLFAQAVSLADKQKNVIKRGLSHVYLSLAQQRIQQWDDAQINIQRGLTLLNQSMSRVNPRHMALAFNTQGRLSFSLGHIEQALSEWEQAEEYYVASKDSEGILGSIVNQAQALTVLGYHHRACKSLFRVIEVEGDCNISNTRLDINKTVALFRNQRNPKVQRLGLLTLGNLLRLAGNYDASDDVLTYLESKVQTPEERRSLLISLGKLQRAYFSQKLKFYQRTSNLLERQSTLERALGHAEESLSYLHQSAQLSPNGNAWSGIQNRLLQLSLLIEMQSELGNDVTRSTSVRAAIASIPALQQEILASHLKTLPPSQAVLRGQLLFARLLLKRPLNHASTSLVDPQALTYAQVAYSGAQQIEDLSTQSQALGVLGEIYERNQQWQDSQRLTERALALANTRQDHQQIAQWQWQLGRIYQRRGDRDQSLIAYQQSVQSLSIVRKNLRVMRNDVEFSFRENVEPVYREYVNLLLQEDSPNSQTQLQRAIQIFDDFQIAELEDFLNCNLQLRAKSEPDSGSAFIYPIVLDDRIEIIIQPPNNKELIRYSTPVTAQKLNSTLKSLRRELERTYLSKTGLKLSQTVYDWVLRPAALELEAQNIKTLVFVLNGPLRNIPLSALHDGERYLVESGYSIALLPGLELFESQASNPKSLSAVTFGLAEGKGKPPLPAVIQELSNINGLIEAKNFLNQSFSKQTFADQLVASSVPIVHLATHGQFSSNPEDTYISTYDQDISGDELSQLLQSRANSPNLSPIELLVLSACKTATGDPRAILGLAGIAIQSGARSTLSSLWAVNDESTAILMSKFYKELVSSNSITKAEALRRAQVQLLNMSGYASPRYWAAFVLVGNWQ